MLYCSDLSLSLSLSLKTVCPMQCLGTGQGGCSSFNPVVCCPFYAIGAPNSCATSCPTNMTGVASNGYICGEPPASHYNIIIMVQNFTSHTKQIGDFDHYKNNVYSHCTFF